MLLNLSIVLQDADNNRISSNFNFKIVTRFYRENHFFFSPSLVGVLRKFCPNRNLTGRVARDELKLFAQSDNVARPLSEA